MAAKEQRISQSSSVSHTITFGCPSNYLFAQNTVFWAECSLYVSSSCSFCQISSSLQVFASGVFPPRLHAQTFTPPFVLRIGFGAIFAGAGYVLSTGDSRNGSGIVTGNCTSTSSFRTLTLNSSLVTKLFYSRAVLIRAPTVSSSPAQQAFSCSFRCYSCDGHVVWNGALLSQ